MPEYDTECCVCAFTDTVILKLASLDEWDLAATCPKCHASEKQYRRVIKKAPAMASNHSNISGQLASNKTKFLKSSERDTMRHEASKRVNKDQQKEAREIIKHGLYEGF